MYAVDDLSDAIDVTREFLTPARPGLWLRLAVVVFFVSSFGFGAPTAPTGDVGVQDDGTQDFEEEWEAETGEEFPWEDVLFALLVVGVVLLLIWLVYAAIAAIMEFVFIESLRSSEVHVRRYFGENVGRGLRLFGFRLAVGIVSLLIVGVPAYLLVTAAGGLSGLSGSGIAVIILLALGVAFVYSLVMRFTTEFVAPVMLLEERGVLSAWGRFWPTLTGNLAEYVVYLILVWIIGIIVSIAATFVVGILGFVLAIPFIVLFVLLFVTLGGLAVAPAILLGLIGLVLFLLLVALVYVPIETYFQYYALLLLGDTDGDLDLIPEQRAAARGGMNQVDGTEDEWTAGDEPEDEFDWGATDDRDETGSARDHGEDDEGSTWDDTEDRDDDRGW